MLIQFVVVLFLQVVWTAAQILSANYIENESNDTEFQQKSAVLSRRKRFLIFPEGSSFQLVMCNTFPSVSVIGDIFFFGYTAALAYELPQDPYSPFMHHGDPLHRRQDTKEIFFLNENGRVIQRRPYERKIIVNPAMAKRSIVGHTSNMDIPKKRDKIDRKQMHEKHDRELDNLDPRSSEFHRTSRALLYRKIEVLLQGQGSNGRECLLKTLCLVGQTRLLPQGTFYQEILRAVFTLPKGNFQELEDKEYDDAHWSQDSCDELYPECPANDVIPWK